MLLFATVALNSCLIGCYLLRPLYTRVHCLRNGLTRSLQYLRCRIDESRERAFRRRTLLLARSLAQLVGQLALTALCFGPSLALAHYQSHWSNALLAGEAIAGMFVAALICGWRLDRP